MIMITLDKRDVYNGYQILINRDYPVREHYFDFSKLISIEHPNIPNSDILLELKTATLLEQLLNSICISNEIIPVSGYRDRAEQERIYRNSLLENGKTFTDQYVALPGRSEHQTGLAIDLAENANDIDFIRPYFPYTGICGDFRKKAASFGFIERYGKKKESITGISHEPWHFRYVGYPHAQIIEENQLCLEEYILTFIKEYSYGEKHLYIKDKMKTIEIFYVRADREKTMIELPEHNVYQLSGNNVDGFIVSLWRW